MVNSGPDAGQSVLQLPEYQQRGSGHERAHQPVAHSQPIIHQRRSRLLHELRLALLAQLRENVRRIARPRAAFDVVEKSLEMIGKRG